MLLMILQILFLFVTVIVADAFCSAMRAKRWRPWYQPRDVIWVKGFGVGEAAEAAASAKTILESYERAGLPRPIIMTVPEHITITRDPAR